MKMKDNKLSLEEFFKEREFVISTWDTGKAVRNLEANIEYVKDLPDSKIFAHKLSQAKKDRVTLSQPRAGVCLVTEHIELLKFLEDVGEADFLPTTIDSYTRLNRYKKCEVGIQESRLRSQSMLNGFPAVNHGLTACRFVQESVNSPLQTRHGTPDARLLAEITLAAGWTSFEGGPISYNLPYAKSVPIEETLKNWKYTYRLIGYYQEKGVTINVEPYGPLTGTLVPPATSNSVAILEAILAAEQGVKSITVGYGACGNLIQDIAAIKALYFQTCEYLEMLGYKDVEVTTVLHQWMGGFPKSESKSFGIISMCSVTAVLAGATKTIVKTPHESFGIPTKKANSEGLKATKTILKLMKHQQLEGFQGLDEEIAVIKRETKEIVDATFKIGDGDLYKGIVKAVDAGIIDIPFAPAAANRGKMMPARDNEGRIRYLDPGLIPFSDETKEFNKKKLQERADFEGREVSFQMTVDDVFAVSKGDLIGGHDIKK